MPPHPRCTARTEVERHLSALDPDKREVIVLTEVMGMTDPEAAEILGIPTGTVWTRLHHARRERRENMGLPRPRSPAAAQAQSRKSRLAGALPATSSAPATQTDGKQQATAAGLSPEDTAYMRAIRFMRAGDKPRARTAAREYLSAFPSGLRRNEMEAVSKAND